MRPNIIMHHGCYNLSYIYYWPFHRCPVTVAINRHQWEVVVETFSCFMCYWTYSSAGPLVSECPPPDTCKATVCWDQVDGREIVGRSVSKQHLHLFRAPTCI